MRLLICEYVTGGGFAGAPLPPGLAREGDMMLHALVKDVAALEGVDVVSVRDARLGTAGFHASCRFIKVEANPWHAWQRAIGEVDAVWPIAPESGGALLRLSELVVHSGRTLIGSRPRAVSLTTSKSATTAWLSACGVPAVPTVRASVVAAGDLPGGEPTREALRVVPSPGTGEVAGAQTHAVMIELPPLASSWYVDVPRGHRRFSVAIGLLAGGRFVALTDPVTIEMPEADVSSDGALRWRRVGSASDDASVEPAAPVARETTERLLERARGNAPASPDWPFAHRLFDLGASHGLPIR